MKVLLAYKPGELRVVEMETPRPGPKELLCKVAHCGVCATDVAIMKGVLNLGDGNDPVYPVRLGHEWSGIVTEAGEGCWRLGVGDRVISDTGYFCGECEMCRKGQYQACLNGRAIGTIRDCWPGAFAEYMLIPERMAYRVPDGVPLDEAALIEPTSIGFYGLKRAGFTPETTLLVVGTGPISLGGMACAKALGIGKTIVAGRKEAKLRIARELGADLTVNMTKENLYDVVMRETGGRGAEIVMDSTGAPELLNDSMLMVRGSGTLVIPAFYEKILDGVKLDRLIVKNCTLVGAAGTPNIGPVVLSLIESGRLNLMPMLTDRFPFDRVIEAFGAVTARNESRIKVMVDFP
ncbi:MAG: alcohol dehydrogenase catalytic domain-containing protein [Clostridia bacterium]|nr:alcohol dehydrogenase catalytic domain-containing protein [Clostridia bacterium]